MNKTFNNETLITIWHGLADAINSLIYNIPNIEMNHIKDRRINKLESLEAAQAEVHEIFKSRGLIVKLINPDWKEIRSKM